MTRCQQDELYTAEDAAGRGRCFASIDELQQWVDALREEAWWDRFYPQVLRVEVGAHPRKQGSVGTYFREQNAGRIEMSPDHMSERIVLHEVAHVLAEARYGSQSHDPWFARVYLELVFLVMGHRPWVELHTAFDLAGIEHDPPRADFEWGRARWEM